MENNEKEIEELEEKEIITTEEDIDKNNNEDRRFYVYEHIRKDNNKCFYVGKGTGGRAYKLDRGNFHDGVRDKYGCRVKIIKDGLTEKEAFALERERIEYYVITFGYGAPIDGYEDFSNNYLTNFTWGGEGSSGYKYSEELKQKMSKSHKGEKHSEEHNKKISESLKGKTSKKVICITTGKIFNSMKEASDWYKVALSNMSRCCRGERNYAGKLKDNTKLQWKYAENDDDNCLEEYKLNISDQRSKKVICITTGKIFNSMKEASDWYKVATSGIVRCCTGERKHAGKLNGVRLQWKYLKDYNNEFKGILINPIIK